MMGFRGAPHEHLFGEGLPRERERLAGKPLLTGSDFAGDRAGRIVARLQRKQRTASGPVEKIDEALLGRLGHGCNGFSIVLDGEKNGRRGKIAIPNIVMHALKVPEALAGFRVEGQQAVGKQIIAKAIRAVKIVSRRTQGEVSDATLFID